MLLQPQASQTRCGGVAGHHQKRGGWRHGRALDVSRPGRGRCQMRGKVLLAVMGSLLVTTPMATAEQLGALLTGYEESPPVATTGQGEFTATAASDGETIAYTETFSGLQGTVTQSHIHIGHLGENGSVVIFLCQTAAKPDPTGLAPACPQEGSVAGELTGANVIAGAKASQQLAAGDLAAVLTAMRTGAAYADIHTQLSPGGEIRGQLRILAK